MTAPLDAAASAPPASQPELQLGGLDDLFGFHLRMGHIALQRDFLAALKPVDLTQTQVAVLCLVAANPGASQIDLAGALGTDRATMMAVVDRLQERELLYRARSATDRRRQELYLTDGGTALLNQARGLIAEHEARFLRRYSKRELEQLRVLLARLYREP